MAAAGDSAARPEDAAQKKNTDCVYFLASPLTCKKGDDCEFRHSEAARINPRDCWYWVSGNCLNRDCSFRHPPLEARAPAAPPPVNNGRPPCYYYAQGYCAKGDRCSFMHVPTSPGSLPPVPKPTPEVIEKEVTMSEVVVSAPAVKPTSRPAIEIQLQTVPEVRKQVTTGAPKQSAPKQKAPVTTAAPKQNVSMVPKQNLATPKQNAPVTAVALKQNANTVSKPNAPVTAAIVANQAALKQVSVVGAPPQNGLTAPKQNAAVMKPVNPNAEVTRQSQVVGVENGWIRNISVEREVSPLTGEDLPESRMENGANDWEGSDEDPMNYDEEGRLFNEDMDYEVYNRRSFDRDTYEYDRPRYDRSESMEREYNKRSRVSIKDRLGFGHRESPQRFLGNNGESPQRFLGNNDLRNVLERRRRMENYHPRGENRIHRHWDEYERGRDTRRGQSYTGRRSRERPSTDRRFEYPQKVRRTVTDASSPKGYRTTEFRSSDFDAPKSLEQIRAEKRKFDTDTDETEPDTKRAHIDALEPDKQAEEGSDGDNGNGYLSVVGVNANDETAVYEDEEDDEFARKIGGYFS